MIDDLKEALRTHTVTITFTKKDGSVRVLKGTLNPSLLPPAPTSSERHKTPNPDVMAVYDVESGGWRSFIIDNLLDFKIEN